MPTARVNDINLYYEDYGEGAPLVLIMGLGANLDWWGKDFLLTLAKTYRVIAFDNRGAGRSNAPEGPYSIAQFASDTAALMDALDISTAHIFGCSMGGMIAQEFALTYPEKVDHLILGCTTCGGKENIPAAPEVLGLLAAEAHSPEEMRDNNVKVLFPSDFVASHEDFIQANWEQLNQHPMSREAFMNQLMAIATWQGTYSRLPGIQHSTMVMHGTEDILIPPKNAEILATQIPHAVLKTFAGCGHGFTGQEPEAVLTAVLGFLQSEETRA